MNVQQTGLSRTNCSLDKYYTKSCVAKECIETVNRKFHFDTVFDIILEPAAGNGSFSKLLPSFFNGTVLAYDIAPEDDTIETQDFLQLSPEKIKELTTQRTLVISNVPFGKQSSLAKKFIRQSCRFAKVLAFILPRSFKKESFQKTFPLDWHCVLEEDLKKNSFKVNGEDYDVPCVFQVWEQSKVNREIHKNIIPSGYNFVKKEQPHDLIVRRVGFYAGKTHMVDATKTFSKESHYFIKLLSCLDRAEEIVQRMNEHEWHFDNHVGPRSIAKTELIPVLNDVIREVLC